MSVKATISIILDIIPVVGGIKMIREAKKKKTFEGDVLEGKYRLIHGGMGILSLILDVATLGVGSTLEKGAYAGIRKTVMKEAMEKAGQNAVKTSSKAGTSVAKSGSSNAMKDQLKNQVKQYRQGNNRGYKKKKEEENTEQVEY